MDQDRDIDLVRRRLLKRLALAGGALASLMVIPKEWVKPIVDTIVVPAHAQAVSGPSPSPPSLSPV